MAQTGPVGLDHRIQALAQELQDLIFDAYLKTGTGTLITITGAWKPPTQHKIDRKSRAKATVAYYSTNTFLIPPAPNAPRSPPYLALWIQHLSASNRDSISKMRLQASWRPRRAVPKRLENHIPPLEEEETTVPSNIRFWDAHGLCTDCFDRGRIRMGYLRRAIAGSRDIAESLFIEVEIPMIKQNGDIEMRWLTEGEMAQMPRDPYRRFRHRIM